MRLTKITHILPFEDNKTSYKEVDKKSCLFAQSKSSQNKKQVMSMKKQAIEHINSNKCEKALKAMRKKSARLAAIEKYR